MPARVLVACIGNIFLGDDAFGVEVAQHLLRRRLPGRVRVEDFGVRSYDLAYALMEDWDLAILVDAAPRGGRPGTVYTIAPELPMEDEPSSTMFDAHVMNPVSVLRLIKALGGKCARLLVVGCEPGSLEPSDDGQMGLSAPVAAAVDEAVAVIERLICESSTAAA